MLWLNARMVPSLAVLEKLRGLLVAGKPGIVASETAVAAALFPPELPWATSRATVPTVEIHALGLERLTGELPLFDYPHDIVRHHLATLAANLEHRLADGEYQQDGRRRVCRADGAKLGQYVVTDTRRGPIVLEAGATIGPYCYLSGPAHLGPAARVIEHAAHQGRRGLGPHDQDRRRGRSLDHRALHEQAASRLSWATATWEAGSTWAPAPATAT